MDILYLGKVSVNVLLFRFFVYVLTPDFSAHCAMFPYASEPRKVPHSQRDSTDISGGKREFF